MYLRGRDKLPSGRLGRSSQLRQSRQMLTDYLLMSSESSNLIIVRLTQSPK